MALSRPSIARASVRAMMTKLSSRLASVAALILWQAVSTSTTDLPSKWPQRFGFTWSSMWIAVTPASSNTCTVLATFIGSPKPVSASTMVGRVVTRLICPERSETSDSVVSPMSGSPNSADMTAPDT